MGWWKDLTARFSRSHQRDDVRILAIMPNDSERQTLLGIAERSRWRLEFAATCKSAVERLREETFAIVLCDRELPGSDWRQMVESLLAGSPGVCLILTSPVNDDYLWQEVIQRGGYDVLTRPFQEDKVRNAIDLAWSYWISERAFAG